MRCYDFKEVMMSLEEKFKKGMFCLMVYLVGLFIVGWFFGAPVFADTVPVNNGNVLCGWFYEVRYNAATKSNYYHHALDFPANKYAPIVAVRSGRVVNADYDENLGNYVDIFDGDGAWRYGHLQNYFVSIDSYIAEGEVFASVGSTGKRSNGPHLHIEYRVGGKPVFFTNIFGVKFRIINSKLQK